jgi:hypothetical protein
MNSSNGNITAATSIFSGGPDGLVGLSDGASPILHIDKDGIPYVAATAGIGVTNVTYDTGEVVQLSGLGGATVLTRLGPQLEPLASTVLEIDGGAVTLVWAFFTNSLGQLIVPVACGGLLAEGPFTLSIPSGTNYSCGQLDTVVLRYNSTDLTFIA